MDQIAINFLGVNGCWVELNPPVNLDDGFIAGMRASHHPGRRLTP